MNFPESLFVSGTDTEIGKTVVSSMLTIGLSAGYWKPVQSGRDPHSDTEFVQQATGLPDSHFYSETYSLAEPMSPHAAADIDGVSIKLDQFNMPSFSQPHLIAEGAGGLIVPLNDQHYVIDLISHLNLPTLLVARSGLGTLNHTLLSLEALQRRNIEIFGVILVGDRHPSNEETISTHGGIENLFTLPVLPEINPETLKRAFDQTF
jgi:dethiobiotin synthetase